ncbi:MAG: ABC transporter substrate-binding protein [Deltaproteobacteria bacterium]|nr:MAG: ABC transporter substrate-binding protein [Deltaproteobacteria bacterium]
MKKHLLLTPLLIIVALVLAQCGSGDEEATQTPETAALGGKMVMTSWGGIFTETTVKNFADPFSEETGVEVVVIDAPGEHAAQLQSQSQANRVEWDVIDSLDASTAFFLWENDLLGELPSDLKAKLEEISVPGAVLDFGILQSSISDIIGCNPEEAVACPTTPAEFWDVENFPGPRSLQEGPHEAMIWALQADGVPRDEIYPIDIDRAFAKLEEIKPHIRVWWTSGDQSQQVFRDREVVIGTIWNGRAKTLMEEGFPLQVSWEGNVYTPAYTVLVNNGPNREAALAYIEWYATHPDAQAAWAETLSYGLSHPDIPKHLSQSAAEMLPEYPANFEKAVPVDVSWWLENIDEVQDRWKNFLAGGG